MPTPRPSANPWGPGNPSLPDRVSGQKVELDDDYSPLAGFTVNHIKYINGYPNGGVRPDADITRAEVAAIIFRLLTAADKNDPMIQMFPDVAVTEWYGQSVSYLASIGVLKGYLDGMFRPDEPVTRAEFATMMSRFDNLETIDEAKFYDTAGHWAEAFINSAAQKGWVTGYPDGTFQPDNNMSRAEVVTVINRVLYRGIQPEDIPFWAPYFNDLAVSHWAYTAIIEAATGHNFERKDNGFEIWTRHND